MAAAPFRPADLLGQVAVHGLAVSPSGTQVVYGRREIAGSTYESRLFAVPFEGGREQPLAQAGTQATAPSFSPDGTCLAFLSVREGRPVACVLELESGRVTVAPGPPSGVLSASWPPAGDQLALLAPSGEHRYLVGEERDPLAFVVRDLAWRTIGFAADPWGRGVRHQLISAWVWSPGGGEPRRVTDPTIDVLDVAWAPDGERLLVVADGHEGRADRMTSQAWWVGLDGGAPALAAELPGAILRARVSPDGATLALAGTDEPGAPEWAHPELLVAGSDGKNAWRSLSRELDRPIGTYSGSDLGEMGAHGPWLEWRDERRILATVSDRGRVHPYEFSLDGGVTPLLDGEVVCSSIRLGGGRIAAIASDGERPADVHELRDGRLRRLTDAGGAWLGSRARCSERVEIPTPWGALDGWLLRASAEPAPLVVTIHGGPTNTAYGPTPLMEGLALASRGIGVLWTNPAGSYGYGRAFARGEHGAWGRRAADEVVAAIDWAVEQGIALADRVGVFGLSYGGYLVHRLYGEAPDRIAAAVSENPCLEFVILHGAWLDDPDAFERAMGIGPLPEALDEYLAAAAWQRLPRGDAPFLLLQAEQDIACPAHQTDLAYSILKLHGKPVEMVRYPDEGHSYFASGRPDRRVDRLERLVEWFARHLQGDAGDGSEAGAGGQAAGA